MTNTAQAGIFESPQVVAAAISATFALATALYVHWRTAKSNRTLEELKNGLAERRDERNARRDYEYQARKRLYTEIEPLLFQLNETTEKAFFRCRSIARTARDGNLSGQDSWLAHEGYYLRSTLYNLLVPAVMFRLIRRRMTFVDLDVDESIRIKYELVKLYFLALTDHFDLARLPPVLEYTPDKRDSPQMRAMNPHIFADQGLVYGHLDQIIDMMITPEGQPDAAITYGQFETLMSKTPRNPVLNQLVSIFLNFEPDSRPVLARLILALATISHLLVETGRAGRAAVDLQPLAESFWADGDVRSKFAWASGETQDFKPFESYFRDRLSKIQNRHARAPAHTGPTSKPPQ